MMPSRRLAAAVLALLAGLAPASARQADLRSVLTAPAVIVRTEPVTSVPLDLRAGKLFLAAEVGGERRRFIFDTGSPTILTRSLAESLGLEIVGRSTGVDANGAHVTMDVAVLDSLSIGGFEFRDVPVMVFDFSDLPLGPCLLDGGIIGSEIFPGSAWRIDLQDRRLDIAASAEVLRGSPAAVRARLHAVGYPHAPVVDYSLGGISDRLLFDTGNSGELVLFRRLLDARGVNESLTPGSTRRGRGWEGESAGGRGRAGELVRFETSALELDGQPLGPLRGTTRTVPPSLLGAGIMDRYVVTLDYPGGRFLLEPRSGPAPAEARPGYAIAFAGDHAEVVQLFDDSAAASAGLRLGDRVVEVQGRSLRITGGNGRCSSALWLAESFDANAAADIVVLRDGQLQTIRVPATPAGDR